MFLDISVLTSEEVIFQGKASSVILPGEEGVFELLPFHKPILSRLITGVMHIDEKTVAIRRGIAKVDNKNRVVIIVDKNE